MADKIVTLHPQNNKSDNLYPRVLGQSVRAGTNIAIDSTANTISVAQSLVDTINGKFGSIDTSISSLDGRTTQNTNNLSSLKNVVNGKQNTLVSGTNLKTVNGNSLLGSGNIAIAGNVTIGYVDIVNNISNKDDGTFWNAFTGHKAILGVYYHKERGASDTYDYEDFYSCMYFFQSNDVDPEATSYNISFFYYPGDKIIPVPTGETIRIVYID